MPWKTYRSLQWRVSIWKVVAGFPLTVCISLTGSFGSGSYTMGAPTQYRTYVTGMSDASVATFQPWSRLQLAPNGSALVNSAFGIRWRGGQKASHCAIIHSVCMHH